MPSTKLFLLSCSLLIAISCNLSCTGTSGTVEHISVYSNLMKKQVPVDVIKPSTYNPKNKAYPVVYLLHSYSQNQTQWLRDVPKLLKSADKLNIILVCPDGGYNSWYFDSPIDSSIRYESFITKDLITFIDSHYNTIKNKKGRAIGGCSMGGHGSLFLGIRHTDLFGAAGSIAGGVDFRQFPNNWDIKKSLGTIKEHPENWENYTVINLVDSSLRGKLKIILDCGTYDIFLPANRNLHQKLLSNKIEHKYRIRPGGHNNKFWRSTINNQLEFFADYFHSI